jgi:hypothetical protein
MNEEHIKNQLLKIGNNVKPSWLFRFKMEYRLMMKSINVYFIRPGAKLRFATAFILALVMMTGGVSTYAYTSPEVNAANILYPVKEGLEYLEARFIKNPEDLARFHMKRAARRLSESEVLQRRLSMNAAPEHLENALSVTMERMRREMNESMNLNDVELAPRPAENFLDEMHDHMTWMNDRLNRMPLRMGMNNPDDLEQHMHRLNRARLHMQELNVDELRNAPTKIKLRELLIQNGVNENAAETMVQSRFRMMDN